MRSVLCLLSFLALASAEYFIAAGYGDANCQTRIGVRAYLGGNSLCDPSNPASTYFGCTLSGTNITYNVYSCMTSTIVATQYFTTGQCYPPSGATLVPSSFICAPDASGYNNFNPKIEVFASGSCTGSASIALSTSVNQCFQDETTDPFIDIRSINSTTWIVSSNCTVGCSTCGFSFPLIVGANSCQQSLGLDSIFQFPASSAYRITYSTPQSTTGAGSLAVPFMGAVAFLSLLSFFL